MTGPLNILLVEDNEGDIFLTREAFEESSFVSIVTVIRDGKAAINFFETLSKSGTVPDLVLLDINLPKMNGFEVLNYLKNNERYKHVPVTILTTSSSENDIMRSYFSYVNCYVTKPADANDYIEVVSRIEDFWMNVACIPR